MDPVFPRGPRGLLWMQPSPRAKKVANCPQKPKCPSPGVEYEAAKTRTLSVGGDVTRRTDVLGYHLVYIGKYSGKTFKWVAENDLGLAGYICDSISMDKPTEVPVSVNKFAFKVIN